MIYSANDKNQMYNQNKMSILNSEKNIMIVIFLVALFLRIGVNIAAQKLFFHEPFLFFGNNFHESLMNDEVWYDLSAMGLINGKGFSLDFKKAASGNTPVWIETKQIDSIYFAHKGVPPAYPLFLALCYFIGGENTLSYFIPQAILGSLTCLLIFLLAKEFFNIKVAILSGFAVALYPDLILWTYKVHSETFFNFLLVLGFLLILKGNIKNNIFLISIGAISFGLASLTRAVFLLFIPFFVIWQALFFRKKDGNREPLIAILIIFIVISIILPWSMRNFIIFGKFTPISDDVYTFLMPVDHSNDTSRIDYYFKLNNSLVSRFTGFMKDNPKEYVLSSLRRFMTFWSPYTKQMKTIAKVYKTITWVAVFPLAFWGLFLGRKKLDKTGLAIIFIFYYSIIHALSFVDSGLIYRYPIQPFLCIFASYAFWSIFEKISKTNN